MIIPPQVRLYAELAAAAILVSAGFGFTLHERHVGAAKIEASDAKALDADKKRADAETALNLLKATRADEVADSAQKAIDDFRTAHPEQPVRLCHPDGGLGSVRQASAPVGGPASPGAGSPVVREVQGGTAGPDIGPGLDALVQAAGRLATLYADRQQR